MSAPDRHESDDVDYVPEHVVDDVYYVPVCSQCGGPAEQYDEQDEHGVWRHGGFRHLKEEA